MLPTIAKNAPILCRIKTQVVYNTIVSELNTKLFVFDTGVYDFDTVGNKIHVTRTVPGY
jgi:hypothetical protein